jgi:Uma2 family endonuclease
MFESLEQKREPLKTTTSRFSYHSGMTTPKTKHSLEEYRELEKRSDVRLEYVDGELHAMAGDKKRNNRIVGNPSLRRNPPKRRVARCSLRSSKLRFPRPVTVTPM